MLEESRESGRKMIELADRYLELRRRGELLIASALERVDMSTEDKRTLLFSELALITADAECAIDGDKEAEDRIEVAMKGFLRHLAGRRGTEMVADACGQVEAALELLAEIRTARRGMIEALREEVSNSGDPEAAKECCRWRANCCRQPRNRPSLGRAGRRGRKGRGDGICGDVGYKQRNRVRRHGLGR